jgi:hypothetical protein
MNLASADTCTNNPLFVNKSLLLVAGMCKNCIAGHAEDIDGCYQGVDRIAVYVVQLQLIAQAELLQPLHLRASHRRAVGLVPAG